jgi:preprotein translocase subunit SecD
MYKNLRWKFLTILAVTAIAIAAFYPPQKKIHLGLDLKGGLQLILQVKTDDALKVETETSSEQLKESLKTQNIVVGGVRVLSLTSFAVDGVPADKDAQFRQIVDAQYGESFNREANAGGNYTMTMKPNIEKLRRQQAVEQSVLTIDRRVNELGVSEPVVAPYGTAGNQVIVQLPGVTDIARAKDIIRNTAILEWKMLEAGPAPDQASLLSAYGGQVPAEMQVYQGSTGAKPAPGVAAPNEFFLLRKVSAVTGRDLRTASATLDEYNAPAVRFVLNNEGVAKFSRVTTANIGKILAIVLDNRVVSTPRIESAITGSDARITGSFTQQEANDLALVLRSGALPASLTILDQQEVGATLGEDSVKAGVYAAGMGLLFVTIFMFVYYKFAGMNALVSIALNLIILLGFMAYLGAVMTLPGIAGFLLTIGMGVDSNVLIFERIREEIDNGKGARQAVAAGFDRVFITIVDTHVSSLISAAFLFQFGTGPIRGFATTLFFGLIANVFTAVFVSRTLFELILSRKPAASAKLSI